MRIPISTIRTRSVMAGGTYVTTEPRLLADLKWMGVNLVSYGSSHADDYGPEGHPRHVALSR
jgi:hypothetical protein